MKKYNPFNIRGVMYVVGATATANFVRCVDGHNWAFACAHLLVALFLFSSRHEEKEA